MFHQARASLGALVLGLLVADAAAQTPPPVAGDAPGRPPPPAAALLPLDPAQRGALAAALARGDYLRAETILVEEINRDPKSPRAAKLLAAAGGLFFLDGQYLNAAIAFKKAEALGQLDDRSRFTLAMAYIALGRREWARPELEKLAASDARNALYPYWLARLDYDAQLYDAAALRLKQAIALDPSMARAHDNLALCYEHLGDFDEAERHYRRAIELNRGQAKPSPWPHVNLAALLVVSDRLDEAEALLREALHFDARLPQAHYRLGQILEKRGKLPEAIESLNRAVELDSNYAEPYYTLGRAYTRVGDEEGARKAFETHRRLRQGR